MKQGLYTVRDVVAEMSGPVFQAKNNGVARRNFQQFMQKVAPHDRDSFKLWNIGEWNDENFEGAIFVSPFEVNVDIPTEEEKNE